MLHSLAPVPGRATTTTVVIGPGEATLKGTVNAPEGLVPGAIVRAERLVGDAVATADVITNPDGTWAIPAVLGGGLDIEDIEAVTAAHAAGEHVDRG